MEGTKAQAFWVGSFAIIGICLLLGFSLRTQAGKKTKNAYQISAEFQKADGLEIGSAVAVQGVNVGTVESLRLQSEKKLVRVLMNIDENVNIRSDAKASIGIKSLLGQHYVAIAYAEQPSTATAEAAPAEAAPVAYLKPGDEIQVVETRSLNEVLDIVTRVGTDASGFFAEARKTIDSLNQHQEDLFTQMSHILAENREQIKTATTALSQAAPKVESVVGNLDKIVGSLSEGRGTLGRLLADDSLYRKVDRLTSNAVAISEDISRGRGTIGKLVADREMYDNLRDAVASMKRAGEEVTSVLVANRQNIAAGFDSLSKAGPSIEKSLASINQIVSGVNEGRGTLGKLVADETLYNEAKDAIKQINQTFEQTEEQSIMRTFLSILFAGAQ